MPIPSRRRRSTVSNQPRSKSGDKMENERNMPVAPASQNRRDRQSFMNNSNTRKRRAQQQRRPTIKAHTERRTDARRVQRELKRENRDIEQERKSLQKEFVKLTKEQQRVETQLATARMRNDLFKEAELESQLEDIQDQRTANARSRSGRTRAINNRTAKIDSAQAVETDAQTQIAEIRARRTQRQSSVTIGGMDFDQHTAPSGQEIRQPNRARINFESTAKRVLAKVSQKALSPQRRRFAVGNISQLLYDADAKGLEVEFRGQQLGLAEALDQGMDPTAAWRQIQNNWNLGSEYFPYKGFERGGR